jgi:hypothetical protein
MKRNYRCSKIEAGSLWKDIKKETEREFDSAKVTTLGMFLEACIRDENGDSIPDLEELIKKLEIVG